jgi:ATP-dependent Zn protease
MNKFFLAAASLLLGSYAPAQNMSMSSAQRLRTAHKLAAHIVVGSLGEIPMLSAQLAPIENPRALGGYVQHERVEGIPTLAGMKTMLDMALSGAAVEAILYGEAEHHASGMNHAQDVALRIARNEDPNGSENVLRAAAARMMEDSRARVTKALRENMETVESVAGALIGRSGLDANDIRSLVAGIKKAE